jgi:probable lipoprotein NlpC
MQIFRKYIGSIPLMACTLFLLTTMAFSGCSSSKQQSSSTHTRNRTAKSARSKQDKVISTARSYLGTPYKWGGTSRAGLDCSGLLVSSFRSAGIDLPRTTADQSKFGKNVSLYQLKPGDLVFFSAKKSRGKISHVGMVTEVRSKREVLFIHSTTSLGVIENNLHSDYYRKIFVKARRPF